MTCTWTIRNRPDHPSRRPYGTAGDARKHPVAGRDAAADRGVWQVNALGPIPVKGLAEPVEVFELVGVTSVSRRLQATAARGLTRFVGRETELAALTQALERAATIGPG